SDYLTQVRRVNRTLHSEQDFYVRVQSLKNELKTIEQEILDKNSRYYPDTKKVMDLIQLKKLDVLGPAGNYIEVQRPEAWKAIEIALGYYCLHAFITFNEKDQKELENYMLKSRIRGIDIHWFPDSTKIPATGEFSSNDHRVLGRVIDLIKITEEPIKLILNEYGGRNWVICKDGDAAHEIARDFRRTAISLAEPNKRSRDDLLLVKRPTKYGSGVTSRLQGAFKKILSVDSRKADLEVVQEEYDALTALKRKYGEERKTLLNHLNSQITAVSDKINDLKQSLKSKSTAFMEIQVKIEESQKELEKLNKERELSNRILEEAGALLEELTAEEQELAAIITENGALVSRLDSDIQTVSTKIQETNDELSKLESILENLNFSEIENATVNLQKNIDELNEIIKEMLEKAANLQRSVRDQVKSATSIELKLLKPQESLLTNILMLETNEDILGWNLIDVHDDIVRLETIIKATQISFEIVEKYTAAKTELDSLDAQKRALEATIQIREAEYQKNFEDWYNQIKELLEALKEKFKSYIESIGGTGYVKISSLEKPSMARLDLYATFREGTTARSVASHTHSGGEKTMIIMAFILALQSIKPQPFYILDEPDAHLDPENRDKLFRMIKEASKDTQYIVISPQENRERHVVPDVIYYLFNSKGQTVIKKLN
ncbi:MAG: AAA family ATPase, partial [Candidatus Helarchaeota archaeon]